MKPKKFRPNGSFTANKENREFYTRAAASSWLENLIDDEWLWNLITSIERDGPVVTITYDFRNLRNEDFEGYKERLKENNE